MPGAQGTAGKSTLHKRRQTQQAQRVGDLGTRTTDAVAELVLRAPEVLQQLLVGIGLLERVQLCPVEVLGKSIAQEIVIAGFTDDRGNRGELCPSGGTPTTLTHDELEGLALIGDGDRANHDRLQNTDLTQRERQLVEFVVIEHRARVARVLPDLMDRDLRELRAGHADQTPARTIIGTARLDRRVDLPLRRGIGLRRGLSLGLALGGGLGLGLGRGLGLGLGRRLGLRRGLTRGLWLGGCSRGRGRSRSLDVLDRLSGSGLCGLDVYDRGVLGGRSGLRGLGGRVRARGRGRESPSSESASERGSSSTYRGPPPHRPSPARRAPWRARLLRRGLRGGGLRRGCLGGRLRRSLPRRRGLLRRGSLLRRCGLLRRGLLGRSLCDLRRRLVDRRRGGGSSLGRRGAAGRRGARGGAAAPTGGGGAGHVVGDVVASAAGALLALLGLGDPITGEEHVDRTISGGALTVLRRRAHTSAQLLLGSGAASPRPGSGRRVLDRVLASASWPLSFPE